MHDFTAWSEGRPDGDDGAADGLTSWAKLKGSKADTQ